MPKWNIEKLFQEMHTKSLHRNAYVGKWLWFDTTASV